MTSVALEAALVRWAAQRPAADPWAAGVLAAVSSEVADAPQAVRAAQAGLPSTAGQMEVGIAMGAALVLAHLRGLTAQPADR